MLLLLLLLVYKFIEQFFFFVLFCFASLEEKEKKNRELELGDWIWIYVYYKEILNMKFVLSWIYIYIYLQQQPKEKKKKDKRVINYFNNIFKFKRSHFSCFIINNNNNYWLGVNDDLDLEIGMFFLKRKYFHFVSQYIININIVICSILFQDTRGGSKWNQTHYESYIYGIKKSSLFFFLFRFTSKKLSLANVSNK